MDGPPPGAAARATALAIDLLAAAIIAVTLALVAGIVLGMAAPELLPSAGGVLAALVPFGCFLALDCRRPRPSLGKARFGLRVIGADGAPLPAARQIVRAAVKTASLAAAAAGVSAVLLVAAGRLPADRLALAVGLLAAWPWGAAGRCLHDRAAGSRVSATRANTL